MGYYLQDIRLFSTMDITENVLVDMCQLNIIVKQVPEF